MREYSFILDPSALQKFHALSKTRRDHVLDHLAQLAKDPFMRPDFIHRLESQRDLYLKSFGQLVVKYYIDAPVCEIRIVDFTFIRRV